MRGQLPRHGNFRGIGILPMDDWLEANATQLLLGDRSTAQNLDPSTALGTSLAVTKSDDGRFNSMLRWPCVDDQRGSSVEFIHDVLCGRGTDTTELIRARRSQRLIQFTHDFGENRMRADSHCDRIETCRHNIGYDFAFRQNHCERARPKLPS